MKVKSPATSHFEIARKTSGVVSAAPDNAFAQMLCSLERDMWRGLSQLQSDRPGDGHATPRFVDDAHRPSGGLEFIESKQVATKEAVLSLATESPRLGPIRQRSNAAPSDTGSDRVPVRPSGNVHADVTAPCPRPDVERPKRSRSALLRPDPAPSKSPDASFDARRSTSAAPFRLTVTAIDGEIAIALRMPHASPDERVMLESRARRAISRYGLHTATLFINGVDRRIDAAGESKYGD